MSAPNFNRIEHYTLELATGLVDRTTWWKDENTREPANVWWLTGGGESRLATVVEIDLWTRLQHAEALLAAQREAITYARQGTRKR